MNRIKNLSRATLYSSIKLFMFELKREKITVDTWRFIDITSIFCFFNFISELKASVT